MIILFPSLLCKFEIFTYKADNTLTYYGRSFTDILSSSGLIQQIILYPVNSTGKVIIVGAFLIGGFIFTIKTPKGKHYFDFLLLKTPIFGKIIKKINLARFSRTLSSLLKTDISITKTLNIASNILGNDIYKKV